jgi:hypothetical protein
MTKGALKRKAMRRVLTLVSKIDELQQLEQENHPSDLHLPSLENMKQALYNWYSENSN